MSASAAVAARAYPPGPNAPEIRRLSVQALGRCDWSARTLLAVAALMKDVEYPEGAEGAEGARVGVRRALGGSGNLRLQLLGALAVPGWSLAVVQAVGACLIEAAPAFEGEELTGLRMALRGLR